MTGWVLDSSAVLAVMKREPGAKAVSDALESCILSAVNAAEIVSKLIELGASPAEATQSLKEFGCTIVAVDAELGLRAGELIAVTRSKGLSLGDRICLALAEREDLTALTADRAWAGLDLDIKVSLIR